MKILQTTFVFLLFSSATALAQLSISLSPTESYLKGKPGETVTQEFVVINDGALPYFLGCIFQDLWFDGEKTISSDLGTIKDRQAGYQFQCSPNKILVPPKYVQKIKVVGVIPKEQEGERFTRFFAQMLPPDGTSINDSNLPKASVGYTASIGATLSLTADGTQKVSSEISAVKVQKSKSFQSLQLKIKNTGNVHLDGTGTIVILDKAEKMMDKVEVKLPFLFPNQTKSISVSLSEKLSAGSYSALMSIVGVSGGPAFAKEFPIVVSK